MKLADYCNRLGWDGSKLSRAAAINEKTARKAISGEAVSLRIARSIASAISKEMKTDILPGDIDGLLERV